MIAAEEDSAAGLWSDNGGSSRCPTCLGHRAVETRPVSDQKAQRRERRRQRRRRRRLGHGGRGQTGKDQERGGDPSDHGATGVAASAGVK
jgi:hypothetical protein